MQKVLPGLAAVLAIASASAFAQVAGSLDRSNFNPAPEGAPAPSTCAAGDAVDQPFADGAFGSAFTSDSASDFITADNATSGGVSALFPAGEDITEVVVWGLQLEFSPAAGFSGPCDPNGADFAIGAWTDNAGVPDVLLDSAVAPPSQVIDLGIPFALGANVHEFRIPVPTGVAADGATWFSVIREPSPLTGGGNQCLFLWVNTTNPALGDNQSVSIDTTDGTVINRTEDVSSCVTTGVGLPPTEAVPVNNPWALALLIAVLGLIGVVAVRRFI